MPRRRDLADEQRYSYQLDHFLERVSERYGLTYDETDYRSLHEAIAANDAERVRELARNKDGTVILAVQHKGTAILCSFDPSKTLPTPDGPLVGIISTVLDPTKRDQIKAR